MGFDYIGLLIFLYPIIAGLFLFIKKSKILGLYLSILNFVAQSLVFIIGSVWFEYQAGLSLGFAINKFTRNVWQGSSTSLLINIGSSYRLMFNDQNTQFSLGINIFAIVVIAFLVTCLMKIYKEKKNTSNGIA
ncbi:MAG: hypothetical protein PF486_11195 [Prolixibacteraceae bacterium]|jgi:hypothetical protein|nr:hypothetical protein [Prolixibacteraceae bacterium]